MTGAGSILRRGVSPPVLEEGEVVGGHDLLGVRHLKEVGVPDAFVALVARGEVAAEGGGMGRADGDDALDALGGERGRAIRGRGPPVVTDEEGALGPQRSDERHRILGQQDRLIPAVRRRRGGRISPHERRDTAKPGVRQGGQEVAIGVGVVGEPVETQHERTPPHLQIVKRHTVGCCVTGTGLHVGSPGERFSGIAAASIDRIARMLVASRAGRARFMARDYERRGPTCQPASPPLPLPPGHPVVTADLWRATAACSLFSVARLLCTSPAIPLRR